ncbi:MAG: hypothetical protein ACREAM_14515 [Blastocatellia bacterium]
MPNEDNTQQMSNSNSQVIAAIRALEDRIANVEGVIVARLNDTRPFEQQVLARLNELIAGQATMQEQIAKMQEQFESFRRETNDNFRLVNNKLDVLNQDVLTVRAQQRDLEKRVTRLEQEPIESAA